MFGETLVRQRLICLVSRNSGCQTREWALCSSRQIFCTSCFSFLAQFCRKNLSGCQQCVQTDGNTVKTVMQPSYIMPYKPLAAKASIFNGCCLQRMLSSISTFSYMMPSKPLAAKASVFKLPKQLSSTATSFMIARWQSLRNQTSPKTDFTVIFLKCWASSMVTLWAWSLHLGFGRTSAAGGE